MVRYYRGKSRGRWCVVFFGCRIGMLVMLGVTCLFMLVSVRIG